MTVFNQKDCETLGQAVINYLIKGYSVIPLIEKKCPIAWTIYMQQRATASDIRWWEAEGYLQNIGLVCGAVSGNLVVIDLDGANAVNAFQQRWPEYLRDTFVVRTAHGLHVYLKCDNLPGNRKVSLGEGHNGIEIRANKQYVVAVPSIHPDTRQPYEIAIRKPVLRLFGLSEVNTWLDTLDVAKALGLTPKAKGVEEKPGGKPSIGFGETPVLYDRNGKPVRNPHWYAKAALADEAGRVNATQQGDQNNSLYRAGQRMGQFVRVGLLTRAEVERTLLQAARGWSGSDQSEAEMVKTIHSGLNSIAAGDGR